MSKVRVYEVAKELGVASKELIERLKAMGVPVKSHSSTIEQDVAEQLRRGDTTTSARGAEAKPKAHPASEPDPEPEPEPDPEQVTEAEPEPAPAAAAIHVPRGVTVKDFAERIGLPAPDVIKTLMQHGVMKSIAQSMGDEEILVVADDLGIDVEVVDPDVEDRLDESVAEAAVPPEQLAPRPPVVTVMGHVDHGKTTVLDRIRSADVVAQEHGGITQHIGAYQITHDDNRITFLDTPGHEAFTAMRARGAQVTDLAVLVVAADDGVMPQTVEALDHARAARIPVVVAVNKIDREGTDPTRVRTELTDHGLQPQEWGGDTLFVDISALTGQNLDDLLAGILLVSEDLDLRASAEGPARGVILEAHLDKGRGPVATVLVQQGMLRAGDAIVAGTAWGKVRAMLDEYGDAVEVADPSRPVLVLGWSSVPEAGDEARVVGDEREARRFAQERDAARRQAEFVTTKPKVSLEELLQQVDELNIVLKADVQGSLEAVADGLAKLDVGDVRVNLIHRAVGAITGSDVNLAKASEAVIVGFNVRPDVNARHAAEAEGVDIRTYRVIYELLEEVERALKGMLQPERREVVLGAAEIRELFKIPRGMAAGCYVTNGSIPRNALVRLVRDGTVVHEGRIASLRRVDDDVPEVQQGFECGIVLEGYRDIKSGDVIEAYEIREISPV